LIKAIAASNKLKNDFDVVAFGGEKFDREELDFIVACGLRTEQVKHCEGNDQTLGLLYRQARTFVYPSLYEGFGLPPIEAMAHDCPVVSSNTSSMPEVIGSAANFFVPSDIESIKEAIERTVYSEQSLKNLVKLGSQRLHRFSWEKCATETLKVYKATVEAL
jgi:glycosyltransferase involved in cell wall biosynthesis